MRKFLVLSMFPLIVNSFNNSGTSKVNISYDKENNNIIIHNNDSAMAQQFKELWDKKPIDSVTPPNIIILKN